MYQNLNKSKVSVNNYSTMETRDHSKNGASRKSHTSRGFFFIKTIVYIFALSAFLLSCSVKNYYQIHKVSSVSEITKSKNSLVYEDVNCKVSYNFWRNGGNVGFQIFNKTDENLYVNLEECFFVCNEMAFDYFKNRVFTQSSSSSSSVGVSNTSMSSYSASLAKSAAASVSGRNSYGKYQTNSVGVASSISASVGNAQTISNNRTHFSSSAVTYNEKKVICIPAKSAKNIAEYGITDSPYRDCNLLRFPSKDQVKKSVFSEENSPYVFSNIVTYRIGNSEDKIKFENKFYVSEIANHPEKEITELKYDEFCNEIDLYKSRFFLKSEPDEFYINYKKLSKFETKY
jgi:hypothetical protein